MLTSHTLTDDDIQGLEVEALRTNDHEWLRICQLAYSHGGRGNSHPLARNCVVRTLNERALWLRAVKNMEFPMSTPSWAVTVRYAGVPGSRPKTRRHPTPEDFIRRTIVGPASAMTVETLLDLLSIPESERVIIRAKDVVKAFVEDRLIPDQPYSHHASGMHYVSDDPNAPLVEWSIDFAFVTPTITDRSNDQP